MKCDYCKKTFRSDSQKRMDDEESGKSFCSALCHLDFKKQGECSYCTKKFGGNGPIINETGAGFCGPICLINATMAGVNNRHHA